MSTAGGYYSKKTVVVWGLNEKLGLEIRNPLVIKQHRFVVVATGSGQAAKDNRTDLLGYSVVRLLARLPPTMQHGDILYMR